MFCPYCRAALPDEAKFCMSCGKTIPAVPAGAAANPGAPADARAPTAGGPAAAELSGRARDQVAPSASSTEPESDSRSRVIALLLTLLLVLLLIGGGLWLFGRSRSGPSVATVPSNPLPAGPSVMKSRPVRTSGPPVAAQPAQQRGMPDDIRRYLAFLQSVEAQRKTYEGQLTNRMLAAVPNLLMPNFDVENVQPPDQQLIRQYGQMAQEYSQATQRFQAASQQVVVPMACRRLHADYSTALSLNPRLISDTASKLSTGDYSGLLGLRNSVGKTIEDNYRAADQELASICDQYGIRKPFDIGNGGSGSILSP